MLTENENMCSMPNRKERAKEEAKNIKKQIIS